MVKPIKLVLLYGGKSGEHEISLRSAASVLKALDKNKYQVIPIGMDKDGQLYLNDLEELLTAPDSLPVETRKAEELPSLLLNGHFAVDAEVVFPVVHGPLYEDGCLQGLLSLANIAYVGCDVLSSSIGMDKDMTRRVVCTQGIQSTAYQVISCHASLTERQQICQHVVAEWGWPLFVKPCSLGSSVGIHKVDTMAMLYQAMDDAFRYDQSILIEAFIEGREIELAVLENTTPSQAPHVSVPGEIKVHHCDGFYSYTAKYIESEETSLEIPAVLSPSLSARLQQMAADIFLRIKGKGMSRVDFFVNSQTEAIYFNEINSLPGFTSISMYPKLWEASGLSYPELLDKLVNLAMVHHQCKQQLLTSYQ